MKKVTRRQTDTRERGKQDSESDKQPPIWTEKTLGKALDVGKQALSTASDLAGLGQEIQRTRQAQINADRDVALAREETTRARMKAYENMATIDRDRENHRMTHECEMLRLQQQHQNNVALNAQRDRVLDKLLDGDPRDSAPQLAASLRTLLPRSDQT